MLRREGNANEAMEWYKHANGIDSRNAWCNFRIGQCLKFMQRYEECQQYFERTVQLDSNLAQSIHQLNESNDVLNF